jgi:predicted Zn finger-like uncharacterized protein
MNVSCPTCGTTYRVDPRRVPDTGVRARCASCEAVFRVTDPERASAAASTAPAEPVSAAASSASAAASSTASSAAGASAASSATAAPPAPFGVADPHGKARRLARALISDIVVYHPERRERSLADGTLRQEFREEIRKSWDEYVGQVGDTLARGSPYFREALNEILAGGAQLF